jgi:uncharacterized protein DUF4397
MRLRSLLFSLFALLCLASCGGSGRPQNSVDVRLFNAVADSEPLDLLIDDSPASTGIPFAAAGPYSNLNFGTRPVKVRSSTTGEVLAQVEASFGPNGIYTMVVQGTRSSVTVVPMNEDNTQVSGRIRLRLLAAAPGMGGLDLYITPTTDISAATPQVAGVPFSTVGTYVNLDAGSYAITITENGTKEILFQAGAQEFGSNTRATIAALSSSGGKLVSAVLLPTLGESRALGNTLSRVKAVNAVPGSSPYNFRSDGVLVFASVPYQANSDYVSSASGSRALRLEPANVPGSTAATLSATLQPARDHTIVAVGTAASPRLILFTDDNTAPAAGLARVRFANVRADGAAVEVRRNGGTVAAAVSAETVTSAIALTAGEAQTIDFVAGGNVVASTSSVAFEENGVYTVYLFGTASSLSARIVRDR